MAEFAEKYLPGYRSEWHCGYYEFIKTKPENFTPNQKVLLMTIKKEVECNARFNNCNSCPDVILLCTCMLHY